MKEKLKQRLIWTLIFGQLFLISIGAFIKIMHLPVWKPVLVFGLLCLALSWLIILFEMLQKDIYNRTFWLMSMFIFPSISPVFFMIRREKLIRSEPVLEEE